MKCEKKCTLEKVIHKFSNLNNNEIYDITGIISIITVLLGTFGFVFENSVLFLLSPLLLFTSFHCIFLMDNKI